MGLYQSGTFGSTTSQSIAIEGGRVKARITNTLFFLDNGEDSDEPLSTVDVPDFESHVYVVRS